MKLKIRWTKTVDQKEHRRLFEYEFILPINSDRNLDVLDQALLDTLPSADIELLNIVAEGKHNNMHLERVAGIVREYFENEEI